MTQDKFAVWRDNGWTLCDSATVLKGGMLAFSIEGGSVRGVTSKWKRMDENDVAELLAEAEGLL